MSAHSLMADANMFVQILWEATNAPVTTGLSLVPTVKLVQVKSTMHMQRNLFLKLYT